MICPSCNKETGETLKIFQLCRECLDNFQEIDMRRVEILLYALKDLAEGDCSYGDDCPTFGSRHGQCYSCKATKALKEYYEGE